jgi:bacterioferritin
MDTTLQTPPRSARHAPAPLDLRGVDRCANDAQASTHPQILAMLDAALATELTSLLRCRRHHFATHGAEVGAIAVAFLVHSVLAQRNADGLAGRIVDLGGSPDFAPDSLARRSHTEYVEEASVGAMIRGSVRAERVAVRAYQDLMVALEGKDTRTSSLVRSIVLASTSFANNLESLPWSAAALAEVPSRGPRPTFTQGR